jgi:hypothetical protein
MKIFIRFVILLVIPVTGCAANDVLPSATVQSSKSVQPVVNTQHSGKVKIINLYGIESKDKKVRLQVMSNGCTKTKSFKLIWQGDNLTVQRLKPDYCRRMPHKIWLEFEIPTLIKEFSVANKFAY